MIGTESYQVNGNTYSRNKYGTVKYETKLESKSWQNNGIEQFPLIPSIVLNGGGKYTIDNIRGYSISRKDTSEYDDWSGGISSEVKARIIENPNYNNRMHIFINKLPNRSKKRLIKIMYLYDLRVNKDYIAFERLFTRLSIVFNFSFLSWGGKEYKFDTFEPTYSLDQNRNRKINSIFRYAKTLKNG